MSVLIVCPSDFTGVFEINTTPHNTKLQACIDLYENQTIKKLLGSELGTLFIADIDDKSPKTQIYKNIFEPFFSDETCSKELESKGIKYILLAVIYYYFTKENQIKSAQTGLVKNNNEASNVLSPAEALRVAESKFNSCLDSVEAIQDKCSNDDTNYQKYNGQKFKVKYSSLI